MQTKPQSDLLRLEHGDALSVLRRLSDGCVHCIVTSPPYWGLRDYGTSPTVWQDMPFCPHEWRNDRYYTERTAAKSSGEAFSEPGAANAERLKAGRWREDSRCNICGAWRGSLGAEPTLEQYVANLVEVFREARRVLHPTGTLWLNLGDSYYSRTPGKGQHKPGDAGKQNYIIERGGGRASATGGMRPKQLLGLPWRVALALQADGWILRSDVIWHKPNPGPESVRDRPTKSHEYLFLFAKQPRYFYDAEAIREPHTSKGSNSGTWERNIATSKHGADDAYRTRPGSRPPHYIGHPNGRNRRTVWTVPTQPYRGAHFATFPERLIEPCILASTSAAGCCPWCLAPYTRVTKRDRVPTRPGTAAEYKTKDPQRHVTQVETVGWAPGCNCGEPFAGPCTVLDPFAGTATAGVVANRHGRRFIGIEMNADYLELARRRLGVNVAGGAADVPP